MFTRKAMLLTLLVLIVMALFAAVAQAVPMECEDGFNWDCLIAIIQDFINGGPWNGGYEVGGHGTWWS